MAGQLKKLTLQWGRVMNDAESLKIKQLGESKDNGFNGAAS